jgi:hypothetical protein
MNRITLLLIIFSLIIVSAIAVPSSVFQDIDAEVVDQRVKISWTTLNESGCVGFVVERSTDGISFLHEVGSENNLRGNGSEYEIHDRDLYKKQTVREFYYRVRADYGDDIHFWSETRHVNVSISGIQQSWGGLKALFR